MENILCAHLIVFFASFFLFFSSDIMTMPTYNTDYVFTLQTLASSYCRSLIALFLESRISYTIKNDNNIKDKMINHILILVFTHNTVDYVAFSALTPLVGHQKDHPAYKNWVMTWWHGYLSAARCKWFAYCPADATAIPSSLASLKYRFV